MGGDQEDMSAVTSGSYETRMTNLESQMDDIQVSIERKMDQSAHALQATLQTQLQSSMMDFMQQLQAMNDGKGEKKAGERPVEAESPGSKSAGSKRRSSEDTQPKEKTYKRRPITRAKGKEQGEDGDSDLSVEATKEIITDIKHGKPGEVQASSGAT